MLHSPRNAKPPAARLLAASLKQKPGARGQGRALLLFARKAEASGARWLATGPRPLRERTVHQRIRSLVAQATARPAQRKARKRLTAALQEVALDRVLGAGDRRLVGQRGLGAAPQAAEQVGADRVEQVVAVEVQAVDESQRRTRSPTSATATAW